MTSYNHDHCRVGSYTARALLVSLLVLCSCNRHTPAEVVKSSSGNAAVLVLQIQNQETTAIAICPTVLVVLDSEALESVVPFGQQSLPMVAELYDNAYIGRSGSNEQAQFFPIDSVEYSFIELQAGRSLTLICSGLEKLKPASPDNVRIRIPVWAASDLRRDSNAAESTVDTVRLVFHASNESSGQYVSNVTVPELTSRYDSKSVRWLERKVVKKITTQATWR